MGRNILKSSVQNATFSIIFQILFRCITFILNAYIIRTVGQDVLGIMNVRLLLLESTILFLSKEPISKACTTDTKSLNWAQVINQVWLSVPVSTIIGMFLVYVWIHILTPTEEIYFSQYKIGCYAVAVSCIIEQMTQPVILIAQSYCFVKLRVVFDTIYIVSRTAIFVYLVQSDPSSAINAFSVSQVVSAIILLGLYYGFFSWYITALNKTKESKLKLNGYQKNMYSDMADFPFVTIWELAPGVMKNKESILNKDLCLLTFSFAKQSVIKQILTEGERYVMTISPVLTFSQQSLYDIVNNLGSLAARFIFRPIEESAYFYFTQMIKRDKPLQKQNQTNVSEVAEVLSKLCKVVISIGLVVVVFGQSYSYTFLYLYGGKKLVDSDLSVTLLRFHSFAVILLAINGVTEGYVFATMNNQQIDKYNYIMVLFSVAFLLISYILTYIVGPVGFVLANCINMSARITHSIVFIQNKYNSTNYHPLKGFIPGANFVLILVISGIGVKLSEIYLLKQSMILHLGMGGTFFLLTVAIWVMENKDLLIVGLEWYKRRSSIKID